MSKNAAFEQWTNRALAAGAQMAETLRDEKLSEHGEAVALVHFHKNITEVFRKHSAPDVERLADIALTNAKQLLYETNPKH